jgi:hypothetical protein
LASSHQLDFNFFSISGIVRFGDIDLTTDTDDEFVQEVKITKITQHPQYVQGRAYFDIAVLETELVKFTENVRPICLPTSKGFRIDKFNEVKHF